MLQTFSTPLQRLYHPELPYLTRAQFGKTMVCFCSPLFVYFRFWLIQAAPFTPLPAFRDVAFTVQ
jgi:hypothetical protein